MMAPPIFTFLASLMLFFAVCSAKPTCKSRSTVLSVSALLQIAPKSASCAGAPAGCFTAFQALLPIANSFNRFGISSPGEIAALISLMAWESDDFHYQVPIAGNPGQGTRNMQSAAFNVQYASSIPALAPHVRAITGGAAEGALSANQLKAVLTLLTSNPDYDFGSAAWLLSTCPASIRTGLQSATLEGWQTYMKMCVYTPPTAERQAGWTIAKQALGA